MNNAICVYVREKEIEQTQCYNVYPCIFIINTYIIVL